ncbi:MAG: type IV pilus modification PilV family protein, partial [Acidimicrobiales bacterium]
MPQSHIPESGLALLEVLVAGSLLLVTSLPVALALDSSIKVASYAQQRLVASQLAGQAMQEVESLPYSDVARGLDPSQVAASTDPNLHESNGVWTYVPTGQIVPTSNSSTDEPPLVPYRTSTTENNVTYTVATYPMDVTTGANALIQVVVDVSWRLHGGAPSHLAGETLVYGPTSSAQVGVSTSTSTSSGGTGTLGVTGTSGGTGTLGV